MASNINLLTNADSNLILTGYTGPNQPAIGRALAARLGRKLVSFDTRLEEHTGMTLEEIREIYGRARLKDLESEVLGEIVLVRGAVVRISSETLVHSDNLAQMAATGPVMCLVADLDAVLRRLHLTMGMRYHNPRERDVVLGELRRAWGVRGKPGIYEVDATRLNEAETVEAVLEVWQEVALQRG